MGDASPAIVGFNAGIFAPQAGARIDIDRYRLGCLTLNNFLAEIEGPAVKRPGTQHKAPAKYDEREFRLIPFEFSVDQAYVLEFGDLYMRVHRNQSTVLQTGLTRQISFITATNPILVTTLTPHGYSSGDHVFIANSLVAPLNGQFHRVGTTTSSTFEIDLDGTALTPQASVVGTTDRVYEIVSPYTEIELKTIKLAQSLDVLYSACPTKSVRRVTRLADDNFSTSEIWTSASVQDPDGLRLHLWPPFAPLNKTDIELTFQGAGRIAAGATMVVDASAPIFVASDVGRWLEGSDSSPGERGFGEITTFTSSTKVTITVKSIIPPAIADPPKATKRWAFGAFDDVSGHPRAISFYEERLFLAGPKHLLHSWWASLSGGFENFRRYADDGSSGFTVAADSSILNTVQSDKQNAIEWLLGLDTLFMGTRGGEFTIRGANIEQGIAPANLFVKKGGSFGSRRDVQPVLVDTTIIFPQRAGRKVKELIFNAGSKRHETNDVNRLAREVVFGRVKYMDYQQEPNKVIWCVQEDGSLSSLTYEKEEGVTAWSTHTIGGVGAKVETVAVIPSATDDEDEVWLGISRTEDGVTKRTVELMNDYWDREQAIEDAVFMDSTISFSNPTTEISSSFITLVLGVPTGNTFFTVGTNPFLLGQHIELTENPEDPDLIGMQYIVGSSSGASFELHDLDNNILTADIPGAGAKFRVSVNQVSGAIHLAGQTVGFIAGGSVRGDVTVSALGVVDLPVYTGQGHIGYRYEARLRTNRIEAGAEDGTAQGKTGVVKRAVIRLDQTGQGLFIGTDFDDDGEHQMDAVEFAENDEFMNRPLPLFDGDTDRITIPAGHESEKTIALKHTQPLPCSIVGIFPKVKTQDD